MRTLINLLTIVLLLSCTPNSPLEEVVKEVNKAQGSYKDISKIDDIIQIWNFLDVYNRDGKLIYYYKRPNYFRQEILTPDSNIVIIRICDGKTGWISSFGKTRSMVQTEINENTAFSSTLIDALYNYKDKGIELELMEDTTIDDIEYKRIKEYYYDQTKVRFYNSETGFVDKMILENYDFDNNEKILKTLSLSDFEYVDGLLVANKVVQYVGDVPNVVLNLEEIKINNQLSDSLFIVPSIN